MNEKNVEIGMHITWLVHDVEQFGKQIAPTSGQDRMLPFGLNYQEWLAIFFDVLEVDQGRYKAWVREHHFEPKKYFVREFDESSDALKDYPMLSRICGLYYDAIFEADEIEQLRQEVLQVKAATLNQLAVRGMEKLLRICADAQMLKLSIYLLAE